MIGNVDFWQSRSIEFLHIMLNSGLINPNHLRKWICWYINFRKNIQQGRWAKEIVASMENKLKMQEYAKIKKESKYSYLRSFK